MKDKKLMKSTGRSYTSIERMLVGEGFSKSFIKRYKDLIAKDKKVAEDNNRGITIHDETISN